MNTRLLKFKSYESHPYLKKIFLRLSSSEREFAVEFCEAHQNLSKDEFAHEANRLFVDHSSIRPKHWKELVELLVCCNS